jgi:alpha-aminoadipate carrier protein LysW
VRADARDPARRVDAEETMATCPECDAEIEIDEFDVDKGDQLSCPECGSNLEVTGVSPIELDLSPEDDEDEEDFGDEDEEGGGDEEDEEEEEEDKDWEE